MLWIEIRTYLGITAVAVILGGLAGWAAMPQPKFDGLEIVEVE